MKILRHATSSSSHHPASLILALGLVALVPAACVLWFMTVAMRNERLAVQERLAEVYTRHLAALQQHVTVFVRERQAALAESAPQPAGERFAAIVSRGLADSAVIVGPAAKARYPAASGPESFAGQNSDTARALQARAADFVRSGKHQEAIATLVELIGDSRLRQASGAQGALIVPSAQLLLVKLLGAVISTPGSKGGAALSPPESSGADTAAHSQGQAGAYEQLRRQTLAGLVQRLNDYADAAFPSSQRRFLMAEVKELAPEAAAFPTLVAEELAAEYLEHDPAPAAGTKLFRTTLPKVWCLPTPDGTVMALFREERIKADLSAWLAPQVLPNVKVAILAPGDTAPAARRLPSLEAGDLLPGWRLTLSFDGADPLDEASARQSRVYLWIGFLVVLIIALLSLVVARFVAAQMRLARLKDELVSTVSHELKTPLASMRALVDTLASGRFRDEQQLREYLALIAKENLRLCHLIENFLAFSRMERGQQRFRFEMLAPAAIAREAVEVLQEKLTVPGCSFQLHAAPDLPSVHGDADALATVLINLLENACKYTGDEKRIALRATAEGSHVIFAVEDNGLGLAPAEVRRIFDRFYQVDQSLTRQRGGCGLGLSIVKFIVEAHHGSVEVTSTPGQGSTFRVRIPAVTPRGTLNPQHSMLNSHVGAANRRPET